MYTLNLAKKGIAKNTKKKIKSQLSPNHNEVDTESQLISKKKAAKIKRVRSKNAADLKHNNPQFENGHLQPYETNFESYTMSSENMGSPTPSKKKKAVKSKQNKNEKDNRKKSPIKLKLPRVPPMIVDGYDKTSQNNHLLNSPPPHSHSEPIMLQDGLPHQSLLPQTPLPLSAISSPSPSNYDLTDRDSVRQLLSSRG